MHKFHSLVLTYGSWHHIDFVISVCFRSPSWWFPSLVSISLTSIWVESCKLTSVFVCHSTAIKFLVAPTHWFIYWKLQAMFSGTVFIQSFSSILKYWKSSFYKNKLHLSLFCNKMRRHFYKVSHEILTLFRLVTV